MKLFIFYLSSPIPFILLAMYGIMKIQHKNLIWLMQGSHYTPEATEGFLDFWKKLKAAEQPWCLFKFI